MEGFDVEATDGEIGKVDESTVDRDHLVVDTGFWIFGKKRLLPAGVVDRVDREAEKVFVRMTKEEIREAPDFDPSIDRSTEDWDRGPYEVYFTPMMR